MQKTLHSYLPISCICSCRLQLHYFVFYNKNRWMSYLEKYKDETGKKKRKGSFLVLLYLIGSVMVFFLLVPILF
jgi:hypothetical protein